MFGGRLFFDPGASVSKKAAAMEVAHAARAEKELVRTLGSVVSHRSLRIPHGASRQPVRVQLKVRTTAGVGGSHVFCFSRVRGKMNETSTRSTGTGGGGVVPTSATRELYLQLAGIPGAPMPGIEPLHWTTEDLRSHYWAAGVCYMT